MIAEERINLLANARTIVEAAVRMGYLSAPKRMKKLSSNDIYRIRHEKPSKKKSDLTTMKDFCLDEASRCGVKPTAIANRISRGKYKGLISIRRKNPRVVFVKDLRTKI